MEGILASARGAVDWHAFHVYLHGGCAYTRVCQVCQVCRISLRVVDVLPSSD